VLFEIKLRVDSKHQGRLLSARRCKSFGDLLGAKYAPAINKLESAKNEIQITDLTFAIFEALVPSEQLEKLTIEDVIRYRKASEKAREAFLEHLGVLQTNQPSIGPEGDYAGEIDKVVTTEILPAARNFKISYRQSETLCSERLLKGAVGYLGSSAALSLFACSPIFPGRIS
jgi:hypothetical protein